ncbi:MAG TPA: polyphosphate kinase 2 [Caulobacteraceae bacterium]|nr:polyphosphate kinase 2 [Caulobacteraceae bacterium]
MAKDEDNDDEFHALSVELVNTQGWTMDKGYKAVIVFEGRDAAGKDGTIRRLTEHLSNRATRVVALPKPSDHEVTQWWFQRYVRYMPSAGEWILFNRSWYNRAGVETVMGFSTPAQQEQFLVDAPDFERMLIASGVRLIKYWLDVSQKEQRKRLEERIDDPLKRLKTGPMDREAIKRWDAYTHARDEMLVRTHTPAAPWTCVHADHKKRAHINVMRHLLHTLAHPKLPEHIKQPDPKVLFPFEAEALSDGRLER